MRSGLTPRQALFVREYLRDLNGTRAAERAGYSPRTAESQASRLLGNAKVRAEIDAALKERAERVEVKADDVLRTLLRILNADPRKAFDENSRLLPIRELPEEVALAISGIDNEEIDAPDGEGGRIHIGTVRKLKFWNKDKAVELAMRHLGLLADKVQVDPGPGWAELVAASMKPREGV